MNVVIDASVAVKWYVKETHMEDAERLLENGFSLNAPELIIPEFGSIIWKKFRNDDITEAEALEICESFLSRNITVYPHKPLLVSAAMGAMQTRQTVYDWTYLTLAVSLACSLVTADWKFYSALQQAKQKENLIWIADLGRGQFGNASISRSISS